MKFSDETLMAFADGELDEATRGAIEMAMLQDCVIAQQVAQHQALRAHVSAAFAPVLDEPVPARLMQRTAPHKVPIARGGTVIQLAAVRASKEQAQGVPAKMKVRWSWPQWGSLAATLVVGIAAGRYALPLLDGTPSMASIAPGKNGTLMAQGELANALAGQASSAVAANSSVKIGLSFVSLQGNYCRSFVLAGAGAGPGAKSQLAGLACTSGAGWDIAAIAADAKPPSAPGSYRMAGTEMPPAILAAIDQRIAGQALDAKGEQQAMLHGWRR